MSRRQATLYEFERPETPLQDAVPETPQEIIQRIQQQAREAVTDGVSVDV